MKLIHLKYKMETGIDAPSVDINDDNETLYVEWLEENLERKLKMEQENKGLTTYEGEDD